MGATRTYRQATDTVLGIVRLATQAEVNTGTDAVKAVTPAVLAGSTMFSNMVTKTNNLSDVSNIVTARTNLGLVPSDTGRIIYVSKSSAATDTRTGLSAFDPAKPFASIAAALSAAATAGVDNTLIYVGPGSYNATTTTGVVVNGTTLGGIRVTIKGCGIGVTTVAVPGVATDPAFALSNSAILRLSDISVAGKITMGSDTLVLDSAEVDSSASSSIDSVTGSSSSTLVINGACTFTVGSGRSPLASSSGTMSVTMRGVAVSNEPLGSNVNLSAATLFAP